MQIGICQTSFIKSSLFKNQNCFFGRINDYVTVIKPSQKNIQNIYGYIPYMFDYWVDQFVYLRLLLKTSMV